MWRKTPQEIRNTFFHMHGAQAVSRTVRRASVDGKPDYLLPTGRDAIGRLLTLEPAAQPKRRLGPGARPHQGEQTSTPHHAAADRRRACCATRPASCIR